MKRIPRKLKKGLKSAIKRHIDPLWKTNEIHIHMIGKPINHKREYIFKDKSVKHFELNPH